MLYKRCRQVQKIKKSVLKCDKLIVLANNKVNSFNLDNKRDIFLSILENHKGIIYKIANSYCHGSEDKKDLVQEIIIQLWLSFDTYDSQYKFSTWIYRIALNTSISSYRKNKTRTKGELEFKEIPKTPIYETEPIEEDSNIRLMQKFIRELREIDKALILLYLDGLNQKEISKIIGITPTNISTKLSRIKKILKEKFINHKNQNHGR